MDILNGNDDTTNMADSTNSGNNNVNSSNNNNNKRDGIDHNRLRQLSNFADQNQDNPSWYWNLKSGSNQRPPTGWPVYRPLSNLSDLERKDIRVGETKMVSHINSKLYEGTGLSLKWGEYYVADDEMDSSDDEQSSLSSYEEVEETDDNALIWEEEEAISYHINPDPDAHLFLFLPIPHRGPSAMNYDQLDTNVDISNPTLMGMPDIILERILHYSTEQPSEVFVLERVCKRLRRLTTGEDFWTRRPASKQSSPLSRIYIKDLPENCSNFSERYSGRLEQCKKDISDLPLSRQLACELEAIGRIRLLQSNGSNAILDVLGYGSDCVADTFRTLTAVVLSMMNQHGPEAHFRLRGDTIGYISELLQGYMNDRLEVAGLLSISRHPPLEEINYSVQRDDMALAFRRQRDIFSFPSSFSSHGSTDSLLDSSSSLPSSSGINWKWPGDNCHDVLPPEAGRRIIRRLAYQAGILEISNEAFLLAEAEMLHALGILLVSAYESSVEMAKITKFLNEEDELAYNEPTVSIDMFNTPPPPFQNGQIVYTIVPGLIRAAAVERVITPSHVYGDVWISSSGFTKEEEEEIERSYYYQSISSSDDDEEDDKEDSEESCSDIEEKAEKERTYFSIDSTWSECSSVEDSEFDMDDYEEDSYLAEYRLGEDEIEAHYNHFPLNLESDSDEDDSNEEDSDDDMAVDTDSDA